MSGLDQSVFAPTQRVLDADAVFNRHIFQLASQTATGFGIAIGASLFFKRKGAAITFFTGAAFGHGLYEYNNALIQYRASRRD